MQCANRYNVQGYMCKYNTKINGFKGSKTSIAYIN